MHLKINKILILDKIFYFKILVTSYINIAASESLIYEGIKLLNLSYPAVSHNYNLIVLLSKWSVLATKSIPTVGFILYIYIFFLLFFKK